MGPWASCLHRWGLEYLLPPPPRPPKTLSSIHKQAAELGARVTITDGGLWPEAAEVPGTPRSSPERGAQAAGRARTGQLDSSLEGGLRSARPAPCSPQTRGMAS